MLRYIILGLVALSVSVPAVAAEELVIYSGRKDKFIKPVIEQFTAQTGVQVVLHSAKSTALINKMRVEGERTDADLFISNDAGNLQTGSDLGLFAALPEKLVSEVDPQFRAADNTWLGLSARARVLVVNTKAETDWIKSVFDLADPRLKDRLAITHSGNGSYIAGVTVYLEKAGEAKTRAWLEGMKANVEGKVFSKHSKIVKAVADGKKDVGLVNHYYIYRHLAEHPDAPIRIVMPDQGENGMGVAWNVAGVAVSKYSKHKALAEQLVGFLASEAGQKQFADVNREYPTRKGLAATPEVPAAGSFKIADVPMYELGKQRIPTLNLIDSVGMP
jgi:iron(III) transport system substrate-binding protein